MTHFTQCNALHTASTYNITVAVGYMLHGSLFFTMTGFSPISLYQLIWAHWLPLTNSISYTPGPLFMAPAAGGRVCPRVNLRLEKKMTRFIHQTKVWGFFA